jgi:hypothetical protein
MANTLTNLIPTLYEALNVVSREMVGFIPAVTRDTNVARAAVGQTVRSPIAAVAAAQDVTPGVTAPNAGDATPTYMDVTLSKSRAVPIRWNGEEMKAMGTGDTPQGRNILRDQFSEAMRKLVNEIEVDLAAAAKTNASRAYGTAGTTPFATAADLSELANLRKILEDNGAPTTDLQFVGNSAAWVNLRGKQNNLFKVNEAGTEEMLREGMLGRLLGFATRNSAGITLHTKGAATGALINNASTEAVGQTTLTLDTITVNTTGILAGDIVTFAADSVNKYVVNTGLVATSGDIVIGKPGLLVAAPDNNAMTIGNNYTGNYGFARSALVLAQRLPALPDGGDMADDRQTIIDPISGLSFEVAVYRQYRQVYYEVAATWGVGAPNGAHIATLLG